MEKLQPVIDWLTAVWGSYPALLLFLGLLLWGSAKKLIKLAVFAGICLLLWFIAFRTGLQLPV